MIALHHQPLHTKSVGDYELILDSLYNPCQRSTLPCHLWNNTYIRV